MRPVDQERFADQQLAIHERFYHHVSAGVEQGILIASPQTRVLALRAVVPHWEELVGIQLKLDLASRLPQPGTLPPLGIGEDGPHFIDSPVPDGGAVIGPAKRLGSDPLAAT